MFNKNSFSNSSDLQREINPKKKIKFKKTSRKGVRLPYHIRANIKEPRETEFIDLKRRKNERFEDYQIRVHFDYLDRREF